MRAMTLRAPGLDNLELAELPEQTPGSGEICVRLRASSLNFHDYAVAAGLISVAPNRILMSDGAGEVVGIGEGVSEFALGDNVVSTFYPDWVDGAPDSRYTQRIPGDRIDGYARDYVCVPATWFTKAPDQYTHAESATLTCAGLTAWRGLVNEGNVKAGDTVLVQGTGGVSMFALQFAKNAGATVIVTSSSDAKLERAKALGADHAINYREEPNWGVKAKDMTGSGGVDHVIEIGGPGTLAQSIAACRLGGHIALIGVLTGVSGEVPTAEIFKAQLKVSGMSVGNRRQQQDMIRALNVSNIRPVIDKTFELEGMRDAFSYQESQQHFGKICLSI